MDFYYRKSMGNGTVTSKFRLSNLPTTIQSKQSSLRDSLKKSVDIFQSKDEATIPETENTSNEDTQESSKITAELPLKSAAPIEYPDTHRRNNCNRCYRLKKKCSREYPKCKNCEKTGAECEYVVRSNKRRKRSRAPKVAGEGLLETREVNDESQVFHVLAKPSEKEPQNAHKLVSVSSLLASEVEDNTKKDSARRIIKKITTAELSSSARRAKEKPELPLAEKLILRSMSSNQQDVPSNLREELINMKSIPSDLPTMFSLKYFENFGSRYPFIDQKQFMARLKAIDFAQESIINLDVYVLMSIGCLAHEQKQDVKKRDLFAQYFNEKSIESVIDVLNLNLTNATSEEVEQNLTLLLLLTLYSIVSFNEDLCWSILGVLDRLVIKLDMYKQSIDSTQYNTRNRLFWSIYNLDKELSLILNKPSQFPALEFIKTPHPLTVPYSEDEDLDLINQEIKFHQFEEFLLSQSLSGAEQNPEKLKEVSLDLEKWRVATSSIIHQKYVQTPYLQDWTSWINLNYYYLLIELDQISPSESTQFTLHFLSNSFALIISDTETESSGSKPDIRISIKSSLYWHSRLFKVIKYSLDSLHKLIDSNTVRKLDLSLRSTEFTSNLQLFVNLLKYIYGSGEEGLKEPEASIMRRIGVAAESMNQLHVKLMGFNVMTGKDEERVELARFVETVSNRVCQ